MTRKAARAATLSVFLLSIVIAPMARAATVTSTLPTGLPSVRNGSDTFNTADLVTTSMRGMLDPSCGGYCIIGACAHLKFRINWWTGRIEWYTIVSPRLQHPVPDLLVSAYNHPGDEPYAEWQATFGAAMFAVSEALQIKGGRPDPLFLDQHQSGSFKDVDIIGHPLAILPQILDRNGKLKSSGALKLKAPPRFRAPSLSGPDLSVSFSGGANGGGTITTGTGGGGNSINVKAMVRDTLNSALGASMSSIMTAYQTALRALQAVSIINDIKQLAEYFKSIKQMIDAASKVAEISARSSLWVNLLNPQFQSPRLFCPNSVRPLQPYYLSFADAFWWRAGWPVTDGPFSGSNHSGTVLNPFSSDTLPVTANPLNPLAEVWGNLYPREGMINQSHDAKTASVIAWRGMDVLLHSIPGKRVGLPLPPASSERWSKVDHPMWQMIYPEVKSCETTPYYPPNAGLSSKDFMEPNVSGGYAWNYYRRYTCCSNSSGRPIAKVDFPTPLCITLDAVEKDAKARAAQKAYQQHLINTIGGGP